jgi:hypothetical protein
LTAVASTNPPLKKLTDGPVCIKSDFRAEDAEYAEKHAVTSPEQSKLITLSARPPYRDEKGGEREMKVQETAAIIPADSIAKGG